LRNRLLVWRFLKKIENEPVSIIHSEQPLSTNNETDNSSWILDLNSHCNHENDIDMDIDSEIVTVVSNHEITTGNYDTMDMEEETDVSLLLKRAIGAERRQKSSSDTFISMDHHDNVNNANLNININHHQMSDETALQETEQFFHDLCAELTSTTAALVSSSSSNVLACSIPSEPALIH
jgi:hypothetical protein